MTLATSRLTEIGEEVVAVARGFSAEMARVELRARTEEEEVKGEVGLTTVEGFLPFLVAPLQRLRADHPELVVDLELADTGPSVWRREVEVAIGIMRNPPMGLIGRRLSPIQFGVFGTPQACQRSPLEWVVFSASRARVPEAQWELENASPAVVSTSSRNATAAHPPGRSQRQGPSALRRARACARVGLSSRSQIF